MEIALPLLGVKTLDIEQFIIEMAEELAVSARVYELYGKDPKKDVIPIFFQDACQEIMARQDGRIPLEHPYLTIQRVAYTNSDMLIGTSESEELGMINGLEKSELFKYWNREGNCYLGKELQEFLQKKNNPLSVVRGTEYAISTLRLRLYNTSATLAHLQYSIFKVHLYRSIETRLSNNSDIGHYCSLLRITGYY
ncbi:MAG: hypothetical protein AAF975_09755 [Spirochaetota bacterium]